MIEGTKTVEEELVGVGIGVRPVGRGLVASEATIELEVETVKKLL